MLVPETSQKPIIPLAVVAPVIASPSESAIRRVESPDLVELRGWLVTRLQEKYGEASASAITGFLRSCIGSNEWWFCRTHLAVGLAQLVRLPLEPQPIAQEFFVFCQEEGDSDAASLYPAMASWAAHQNASRLIVSVLSDVKRQTISGRLGCSLRSTGGQFAPLGRVF